MTVTVANDNSGCLFVIAVTLILILLQLGAIESILKENVEQKPQTETVQTNEVQE